MKMQDALSSFLARCVALNLAGGSVVWYRQILRAMAGFLASRGVHELGAVTPALLREHLAYLRQNGQCSETVFKTHGAIGCAFRFWKNEGAIPTNPMELVEKPRHERVLIRPLSPEQASRLLEMADTSRPYGLRSRALLMLMLDSGLRIAELLSLEAGRVDWANCTATVMGKGRKERTVPFSERTRQSLSEYAQARAQGLVKSPRFFLNRFGGALSRYAVRRMIIEYGRKAGIEGVRLSPHTLRHTFAVLYIRNGGDAFSLQDILGHSTLQMTKRYVHLGRRDVSEQHRKFSPMDSLLRGSGTAGVQAPV
jgi:site-specific recombinase XerD